LKKHCHLSLQVRGKCSGVCFASDEVGRALQPRKQPHQGNAKKKKELLYPSPLGQLKPLEEALAKYIFKQNKQGVEFKYKLTFIN
jgi:hypothetical protein